MGNSRWKICSFILLSGYIFRLESLENPYIILDYILNRIRAILIIILLY